MKFYEISKSAVVCQDSSYYLVNSCCINLGKEIIFVDTCLDTKLAAEFRAKMLAKFNPGKETIIITHSNGDHYNAIKAYKDIPVVVCEELFNTNRAKSFKNKVRSHSIQTFSKEIVFGSTGNELIFRLVGGHTADSIYGYFPSERILIAGDNLISNMPQYFPVKDTNL
ncbi:MAG: MBL fold metallo-hydrolase, partial [Promethearchaeota archaeon]